MNRVVRGPSYRMSRNPELIPEPLRSRAQAAKVDRDTLDPINLYNINWYNPEGKLNYVVLPTELTGVEANIIVMLGADYPSGAHKVGPAYFTLIEDEINNKLKPGMTVVGPSTGNFGIGTAYVSNLKGYPSVVVMPDNMSKERYERIERFGGKLDLTPGTESDVDLVLDRVRDAYLGHPDEYLVLAQFELLQNYRFHRFVTGNACIDAAKQVGNGRIASFVSAPGSAGTLAAGDEIKTVFGESITAALEPYQCSTLYNLGLGVHRIEGIGDKMVTLIHNVRQTDYLALIQDSQSVEGIQMIMQGVDAMVNRFGIDRSFAEGVQGKIGISAICNIIGAIKMAKTLGLGKGENVVTIATDSMDRYGYYLSEMGELTETEAERQIIRIFHNAGTEDVLELDNYHKQRLFNQKSKDWMPRGYTHEYLESMKSQAFWDAEYARISEIDKRIEETPEPLV